MTYYRIVGGLGNQLFGLSRAYLLHKEIGKRIAIDVSHLDHTLESGPDWKDWNGLEGWSELVKSPKHLTPPNQLQNLSDSPKEENFNTNFYTGWKFSLEEVLRSGLFSPGITSPVITKSASVLTACPSLYVYLNLLLPSAPAKVISLSPSGNGMTAETVWEGGPPTKMLTFRDSPFLLAFV
jgi:hypothetical protein